mmetsp:Transcript_144026/g.359091  ORF Transcript_144026/g.359091 Transcript_144026/m.359091 type:complete len:103 (-) Transcript_144026:1304-1612(-)
MSGSLSEGSRFDHGCMSGACWCREDDCHSEEFCTRERASSSFWNSKSCAQACIRALRQHSDGMSIIGEVGGSKVATPEKVYQSSKAKASTVLKLWQFLQKVS